MKYYIIIKRNNKMLKDILKNHIFEKLNDAIVASRHIVFKYNSVNYNEIQIKREDGIIYSMNEYGNFTFERVGE